MVSMKQDGVDVTSRFFTDYHDHFAAKNGLHSSLYSPLDSSNVSLEKVWIAQG